MTMASWTSLSSANVTTPLWLFSETCTSLGFVFACTKCALNDFHVVDLARPPTHNFNEGSTSLSFAISFSSTLGFAVAFCAAFMVCCFLNCGLAFLGFLARSALSGLDHTSHSIV